MEPVTPDGRPEATYYPDFCSRYNLATTWADMWKAEQRRMPVPDCLICGSNNVTGSRCKCGRWSGKLPMNVGAVQGQEVDTENMADMEGMGDAGDMADGS